MNPVEAILELERLKAKTPVDLAAVARVFEGVGGLRLTAVRRTDTLALVGEASLSESPDGGRALYFVYGATGATSGNQNIGFVRSR